MSLRSDQPSPWRRRIAGAVLIILVAAGLSWWKRQTNANGVAIVRDFAAGLVESARPDGRMTSSIPVTDGSLTILITDELEREVNGLPIMPPIEVSFVPGRSGRGVYPTHRVRIDGAKADSPLTLFVIQRGDSAKVAGFERNAP